VDYFESALRMSCSTRCSHSC